MLRILHGTNYDFIRPWRLAVGITVAFILAGFIFLGVHKERYGSALNQSIEFTGGTLMQVQFRQAPHVDEIRSTVDAAGYPGSEIQQFGSPREFTVRAAGHTLASNVGVEQTARQIQTALEQKFGAQNLTVVRSEIVGARVGAELTRDALIAILISLVVTLLYLAGSASPRSSPRRMTSSARSPSWRSCDSRSLSPSSPRSSPSSAIRSTIQSSSSIASGKT
jgi:preprotein translocase subunit SecF